MRRAGERKKVGGRRIMAGQVQKTGGKSRVTENVRVDSPGTWEEEERERKKREEEERGRRAGGREGGKGHLHDHPDKTSSPAAHPPAYKGLR